MYQDGMDLDRLEVGGCVGCFLNCNDEHSELKNHSFGKTIWKTHELSMAMFSSYNWLVVWNTTFISPCFYFPIYWE